MKEDTEERYKSELLSKMDIKYFRNNPEYLGLWMEYYEKTKDPKILLLMYHKKIGIYYHWIYIEFSKYLQKLGKNEIADFIVRKGIANGVYDQEILLEHLEKIPKFTSTYNKNDIECIFNQKNISLFGRIWNHYDEYFVYEKYFPEGGGNMKLLKLKEYQEICGDGKYKYFEKYCPRLESVSTDPDISDIFVKKLEGKDIYLLRDSDTNGSNTKASEYEHRIIEKLHEMGCIVFTSEYSLEKDTELYIDDFVYYVQENGNRWYTLVKIAHRDRMESTIGTKTILVREIDMVTAEILAETQENEYFLIDSRLHIAIEYNKLIDLENALEYADGISFMYYLQQICDIIEWWRKKNIGLRRLDCFLNQEFRLNLKTYEMYYLDKKSKNVELDAIMTIFDKFKEFSPLSDVRTVEDLNRELKEQITTDEFVFAILKHKRELLASI